MLKRFLTPTNRKARILVGLILVGLFCTQFIPAGDQKVPNVSVAIAAEQSLDRVLPHVRDLAAKDHAAALEQCLANYQRRHGDFSCTFLKQERLNGKIGPEQEISVKFRREPFSVAMAWTKNPPAGDRVLYWEGKWNSQLLVRPSNPLARALTGGMVQRQPDGEEAKRGALRPISLFGFERGIQDMIDTYRRARKSGDLREDVDPQDHEIGGRKAILLVRTLPDGKGYRAHITKIYIDQEYSLPIMVEGFGWQDDEFLCRYLYKDLDFSPKFTDEDFVPEQNGLVTPK